MALPNPDRRAYAMVFIDFLLRKPLLINLILIVLLVLGILSWNRMPQEIFPIVVLDIVKVSTEFEGASPLEVERQITLPLEEEFGELQDVDYIHSVSSEGFSNIYINLNSGSDVNDFIREAQNILDSTRDLPKNAETPTLKRIRARWPVITLTLYSNAPDATLYEYTKKVRREMQEIPGVAAVSNTGVRDPEIYVRVNPMKLAALGISEREIQNALSKNLLDLPGGIIKSNEGDIRLRGRGTLPEREEIKNIVVRSGVDGNQLRIGDVADVEFGFEESKSYARFNGKPSVNLTVTKAADASTVKVSEQIRALSDRLQGELPPSINAGYHTDLAEHVRVRINTVKSSGMIGLILVLLSLCILLNFRIALVTAFGIPVSFMFSVVLLYLLGYTINMISLFAFLIVLGMIVDDAIIVTENIYRHIEGGMPPRQAAILGAREVFWPVVVSTLTTIAAFLPMLAISGVLGTFIAVIPVVVSLCLLGSLLEAFAVLPMHSALLFRKTKRRRFSVNWEKILGGYKKLLLLCILNRYPVACASVCVLALSVIVAKTHIPFQLFGEVETGQFFIDVETANTFSLEDSLELARGLEQKIYGTLDETEMKTLISNVGISVIDFNRNKSGNHVFQFIVDLQKPQPQNFIESWITPLVSMGFQNFGSRQRTTDEIIEHVRQLLAQEPAIKKLGVFKPDGGPAGDDIEIGIVGEDLQLIKRKANEIRDYLKQLNGVADPAHDQEDGKLEYIYSVNAYGEQLGLSQADLADVVRDGYLGKEVAFVTRGENRTPVRLLYTDNFRNRSDRIETLPIALPNGNATYLGEVADIHMEIGINQIRRRDQKRMAKVTADVDSKITTPSEVTQLIDKRFGGSKEDIGYELNFLGEKKDAEEAFKGMNSALAISLMLIFIMLVALFGTLRDPFVIMIAIPFGLVGVVIGHLAFGYKLQFLSAVGTLALCGIIVNDSLILVNFIQQLRNKGKERVAAVIDACAVRARPILLTTITTFLGVSPLIFFSTGQTKFMAPMAVSLGFGLLFATALILLALPCFYLIMDDIAEKFFGTTKLLAKTVPE
ncbi:MAG: efflux RND transporter permease subunit [Candidatus Eutrophobiaceae bacterium]